MAFHARNAITLRMKNPGTKWQAPSLPFPLFAGFDALFCVSRAKRRDADTKSARY